MKLPISISENLIAVQNGDKIPFSKMKHATVDLMLENGVLKKQIQGRSKVLIYLTDKNKLIAFLKNHFGIESLENYVHGLRRTDLSRAEAVEISSNSKLKSIRTFKGFLVNSYQPIECVLNNKQITIEPTEGTFTFIYDYETFFLPNDTTVIGIENSENFRYIQKQKGLFNNIQPLFVSRYPQSKDLIKWLQAIPNRYLHFGDFDFAGLNIYVSEFKKYLQDKASFFLPMDIEKILAGKGNRKNYDRQTVQFDRSEIKEENVLMLLRLIEKYKKGLDQEIFST
ncbi:MAG TPA: hypothetical protein DGG95_04885 [Cytophagales bacterium]|jgi:hypothetical protein|nr:hypothetical protein [Cytophagales bacterium]